MSIWKSEEIEKLLKLKAEGFTNKEIALKLKRTKRAVEAKAQELKLTKKKWTKEEDDLLYKYYKIYKLDELTKMFSRTKRAIKDRINKLQAERG